MQISPSHNVILKFNIFMVRRDLNMRDSRAVYYGIEEGDKEEVEN